MTAITLLHQPTCPIDTNKTLYEIAYGKSFSQENSQEELPSPVNKIAHSMIKSHQDQLRYSLEIMVNMNPERFSSLSTSDPLRPLALVAVAISPIIALKAALNIHADRHKPIKDRLPALQTDFPFAYTRLMRRF
jgi:hypothetical protein